MRSSVSYWFGWLLLLFVAMPMGELGVKNASAGTGYIDAQGKWHFSVVFIQPDSPATQIDVNAWINILNVADTLLYQATNGKHQIGAIALIPKNRYDATADLIIWRKENLSRADVFGINRLGYHVYISDQLRDDPVNWSPRDLAKVVVHELGHYLYSMYDEYRNRKGDRLRQQCIYREFKRGVLDSSSCLMEDLRRDRNRDIRAWCYRDNHEVDAVNSQRDSTWQSQDNDSLSCWSGMKRIYPQFFAGNENPLPPNSVNMAGFLPWTPVLRTAQTELVVAVDANISPDSFEESVKFQMLERIFVSNPSTEGYVSFVSYNGNQILASPKTRWEKNLDFESLIPVLPPAPGANLDQFLQVVLGAFANLADPATARNGTSRTLLIISTGLENPAQPALSTTTQFRDQNIRTTIGFVRPVVSISDNIIEGHRRMAEGIGGTVYDATFPSVTAYQAIDAANKQLVFLKVVVPDTNSDFREIVFAPKAAIGSSVFSVSWPLPNCEVEVTMLRNGTGGPITTGNQNDFVGRFLKARNYFGISEGEEFKIQVKLPKNCGAALLPVIFSVSDEDPLAYLTAIFERQLYGLEDNHVIHARVTAPYPLVELDEFLTGQIDRFGEFVDQGVSILDDGVARLGTPFFDGDWIDKDGVYSKIFENPTAARLQTVRFSAANFGGAKLAAGELFSDAAPMNLIPEFQRVAFATYFVDAAVKTNLHLELLELESIRWPPVSFPVTFTGTFKLPFAYPHVFSIIGTVRGARMKIDGNTFEFQLNPADIPLIGFPPRPDLEALKRSASLKILFRTGDLLDFKLVNSVDDQPGEAGKIPQEFRLYANYPNPFNIATRLVFDLPKRSEVSLNIYDISGRKIRTLLAQKSFVPGSHEIEWDGSADDSKIASSGLYFVRLTANGQEQVQKLLLVK